MILFCCWKEIGRISDGTKSEEPIFPTFVFEISIKDSLMSENNKLQKKFVQINISLLYL
jgi:hypothetical protein